MSNEKPLFSIHLNGFIFSPHLIPTLGFLFLLPLLLSLGLWQWHRAHIKQEWVRQYNAAQKAPAQPLSSLLINSSFLFAKTKVEGHYDNQHIFFVENVFHDHQVGCYVLVPFQTGSQTWIIVNQGWVPLQPNRQLPSLAPISEPQTLTGLLEKPSGKGLVLKDISSGQWPRLIPKIDMEKISRALDRPILPFILLLAEENPHGYIKAWKPTFMSPEKHFSYAIQWFALALTLVIIYVTLNLKKIGPDHD